VVIKRCLLHELKKHLSRREISFVVGPRQAGKTTLLLLLKDFLEKEGKRTVFFNLDIESHKVHFKSQSSLLRKIELEIGKREGYVFIDEIQRKENAGVFLKGLYDMGLPYKFIVSGSGSVELKQEIYESLAGRKRIFELTTLSFKEFVNFRTDYRYEEKILEFFEVEPERGRELLEEYLGFGGYPRVVLEEEFSEKLYEMEEIYQSYIEKDITWLLRVKKTDAFSNLVKILAARIGSVFNYSQVASSLGLSFQTLKEYLWFLEKTFVICRVSPYFRNIEKEITKAPVFYFYDLGMRNFALGVFGHPEERGFLFQNFVFNLLKQYIRGTPFRICYWRTANGAEVDFVIDTGRSPLPVEVKYQRMKTPGITRSLRSFIKHYKPEKAFVVNLDLESRIEVENTTVHILPYYRLLENPLIPENLDRPAI